MGNIIITYGRDGQEVDPNNLDWGTRMILYNLQEKYQILNQLELEDDIQITFNMDGQSEEIDWQFTEVPDYELVKTLINESARYQTLRRNLDRIVSSIERTSYQQKNRVSQLANEALNLIINFEPSEYFDDPTLNKQLLIDDLRHTIGKEVKMLISYGAKTRKEKNMRINDARRYLVRDIEFFRHHLTDLRLTN